MLLGLPRFYTEATKKRRNVRKSTKGKPVGFGKPIQVSEEMQRFFASANLGLMDPRKPASDKNSPLAALLSVVSAGVTTRAILTPLFSIYAHINKLQKDADNQQYLSADGNMMANFGGIFPSIQKEELDKASKIYSETGGVIKRKNRKTGQDEAVQIPVVDGQPLLDKRGQKIEWFQAPERFRFASIQSIIAKSTVDSSDPLLSEAGTLATLAEEQKLVSCIEEQGLSFHDGQGRQGAYVSEAEHPRAVGDDRHHVGLVRQFEDRLRVPPDLPARLGHARRIPDREIIHVPNRALRRYFYLAPIVRMHLHRVARRLFGLREEFFLRGFHCCNPPKKPATLQASRREKSSRLINDRTFYR